MLCPTTAGLGRHRDVHLGQLPDHSRPRLGQGGPCVRACVYEYVYMCACVLCGDVDLGLEPELCHTGLELLVRQRAGRWVGKVSISWKA